MVKTHISPKGINRGGFPQNHVAVDCDDMAVHNVDSTERRLLQMRSTALYQRRLAIYNFDERSGKFDKHGKTCKRWYGGIGRRDINRLNRIILN